MRKILTLTLAQDGNRILLGMKKRGFGAGRWNGFGGKVEEGESIPDSAFRETLEEAGITITDMEKAGIHEFEFENKPGDFLEVHVFRVLTFTGEPTETEEMRPEWFRVDQIPYEEMWPDDRHWLPYFLAGKKFRTKFLFGVGDVVLKQDIQEVESF